MASKKYTLILALLGLLQTAAFGQSNNANADWAMDSSKISTKMMPQHNEFMNNQYPYPSKPRNQWELGISGGLSGIIGDIDPRIGFGGGISVRKALGHIISVRAGWNGSINYGLDYRLRTTNDQNGPWQNIYLRQRTPYVANYRNQMHQLSLDFIASLNTSSHYRGNPKTNVYILAGYTAISADVDVNALNGNTPYNFPGMANYLGKRKDIKKSLRDALDDSYENNASVRNDNRENAGRLKDNQIIRHGMNVGAGIAFKVSDRVNIGFEQRFTLPFDDNMDGIYPPIGNKGNDFLSATQLRLNFNIGSTAKAVAPLWWINPNNFIYNEINTPKHMKIPTPVLPDADGDGITDQFDQEPNTPAGAAVDSHGVARDSDGDGVPDYRDKELLTPQNCFPVNADGVGTCPESPCCTELRGRLDSIAQANACTITGLPSIQFRSGSVSLSSTATASLTSAAQQINANANCRIRVVGYGASNKREQQLSWDRVNSVIRYLVEKQGISESRFIFSFGQEGDANTVDLEGTTEEGPNTVPAPHPNLRRRR
jgi:outer membrane protein OmpA-like peptidoglycan-associated protein/opacity protein-like surface antigen